MGIAERGFRMSVADRKAAREPMADTVTSPAERLKVFISYARADGAALAEDLVTGLGLASFEPFIDRHDIAAAEDLGGPARRLDPKRRHGGLHHFPGRGEIRALRLGG